MEQPNTPPVEPRRRSTPSEGRNAFVYAAMALVVAVLGLAAYLQLDAGLIYAVVLAGVTFAVLFAAHALVRRGQMVADLEAELEELRAELAAKSQPAPTKPARNLARPLPPALPDAVARPPMAGQPATDPRLDGEAGRAAPKLPTTAPAPSKGASPSTGAAVPPPAVPPLPSVDAGRRAPPASALRMDAPKSVERAQERSGPGTAPPPAMPSPELKAGAERQVQPHANPQIPVPSAGPVAPSAADPRHAPRTATPPAATRPSGDVAPDASMTRYWSVRPGQAPEPSLPMPELVAPRVDVAATRSTSPPMAHNPPVRSPAAGMSLPPPVTTAATGRSPRMALPPAQPTRTPVAPVAAEVTPPSMASESAPPAESAARAIPPRPTPEPTPVPVGTVSREPVVTHPQHAPVAKTPATETNPASTKLDVPDETLAVETQAMKNLMQQLASQLAKPFERPAERREPTLDAAAQPGPAAKREEAIDLSVAALRQAASELHRSAEPAPTASTVEPAAEAPSPYARLAAIAEAVESDRMDLLLDPIMALADRKARHFEVSVRLRAADGELLIPDDVKATLAGTGLLARIDAAKLTRSAAIADRLATRGNTAALFANIEGESLSDNGFLDTFADTFLEQQPLSSRLVLSFSQADVRAFGDVHWEALSTMSELGFRFALEHVTDLDMDFEMLRDNGFAFVKLDAAVFLEGMRAGDVMVPSPDICRHMAGLGFGLIVGGIIDEASLARIMGFGVVFGQGTLFGRPHAVKVEARQRAAA